MPAVRMRVFVVASIVWWWFVVWTNPIAPSVEERDRVRRFLLLAFIF